MPLSATERRAFADPNFNTDQDSNDSSSGGSSSTSSSSPDDHAGGSNDDDDSGGGGGGSSSVSTTSAPADVGGLEGRFAEGGSIADEDGQSGTVDDSNDSAGSSDSGGSDVPTFGLGSQDPDQSVDPDNVVDREPQDGADVLPGGAPDAGELVTQSEQILENVEQSTGADLPEDAVVAASGVGTGEVDATVVTADDSGQVTGRVSLTSDQQGALEETVEDQSQGPVGNALPQLPELGFTDLGGSGGPSTGAIVAIVAVIGFALVVFGGGEGA